MINSISINYADKAKLNQVSVESIKNNINMWLSPLANDINKEGSIVKLFVDNDNLHHISFSKISDELKVKAIERLKLFQHKYSS